MFTGMRPVEATLLPYFGSKETVVEGVKYWLIYGFAAKKGSSIPPFEMWVTNNIGYQAFQTARRIADLYYQRNQRQPIENTPKGVLDPEMSPLFLHDNNAVATRFASPKTSPCLSNSYIITTSHYNQLKMTNTYLVWAQNPAFAAGKPVPCHLHLSRRY